METQFHISHSHQLGSNRRLSMKWLTQYCCTVYALRQYRALAIDLAKWNWAVKSTPMRCFQNTNRKITEECKQKMSETYILIFWIRHLFIYRKTLWVRYWHPTLYYLGTSCKCILQWIVDVMQEARQNQVFRCDENITHLSPKGNMSWELKKSNKHWSIAC